MKNFLTTLLLTFTFVSLNYAQKYAYVDSKYILETIPEYEQNQTKIDKLSEQWQNEVEKMWEDIAKLEDAYEADKIILPKEIREKREQEITIKKQKAREFQNEKFGINGELFKLRKELIQPWQEKLYNSLREYAAEGRYAFIFDISEQSTLLYADPRYDKSDQILKRMGVKRRKKDD